MNTWLTEMIYTANERIFTTDELDKMCAYYATVPQRLEAVESLERLEPRLAGQVAAELQTRFPNLAGIERLSQDVAESVRVVAQAMLADDPRLIDSQLLDHIRVLQANAEGSVQELQVAYNALRACVNGSLPAQAIEYVEPYFQRITNVLMPSAMEKNR